FSRDWSSDVCSSDLALVVFLAQVLAEPGLGGDVRRQFAFQKGAHFIAEGELFSCVIDVHGDPPRNQPARSGCQPENVRPSAASLDRKSVVEGKRVEV